MFRSGTKMRFISARQATRRSSLPKGNNHIKCCGCIDSSARHKMPRKWLKTEEVHVGAQPRNRSRPKGSQLRRPRSMSLLREETKGQKQNCGVGRRAK